MKTALFTALAAGATSITFDEARIGRTLDQVGQWAGKQSQDPSAESVVRSLYELSLKNDVRMWTDQEDIVAPIAKDIRLMSHWLSPNSNCDANKMAECLLEQPTFSAYDRDWEPQWELWDSCAIPAQCAPMASKLSVWKKMNLKERLGKDQEKIEKAL